MGQSISQERHPTHQQSDDDQENGLTSPMATGGQAIDVSRSIPEMEEMEGHLQPVFQPRSGGIGNSWLNGGEFVPRQESIAIQKPGTCELVNGQHRPRFQQGAQANGLSCTTQEIGMDTLQRQDREEVPYPIEETEPFAERTPDEHEDVPPCPQLLNGAYINAVSSTGEREQAVQHTCSHQELKFWRQKSDW